MITRLTGQGRPQWITDARDAALPGISSFAKGLEQDSDSACGTGSGPGLRGWLPGEVLAVVAAEERRSGVRETGASSQATSDRTAISCRRARGSWCPFRGWGTDA